MRGRDYIPKHCHHAATGRGYVKLGGKPRYTGRWGTPEAQRRYDEIVRDWLACRREPEHEAGTVSVEALATLWLNHQERVQKHDSSKRLARGVVRDLIARHGSVLASDFGPKRFADVLGAWATRMSRRQANRQASTVRRLFAWGVAEELVEGSVWHALCAAPLLRKGAPGTRERPKRGPAPEEGVAAVLGAVRPMYRAMIQIQRLTGMRPGEVCKLRPCEIDRSGEVWIYRPTRHKDWLGAERVIAIGPKAQEILKPWLDRQSKPTGWLFATRRCKGSHVSTSTYNKTVNLACHTLGIPVWSVNSLRHSAATQIRKAFGVEAAQAVLGHDRISTTEIYAEKNLEVIVKVMKQIG